MNKQTLFKILLIVILLLGALVRLVYLDRFPAGLNADEAALGYNAYSLLKTGKDEYGKFMPFAFKSFGDYKPGLYVYLLLPFVAFLGLNEWAVRLPAALFGVGTIFLVYILGQKLFQRNAVSLSAAFLLAITPWHIHFSRGGWESNVASFFITLGIYFLVSGLSRGKIFFGLLSFLLAMYLYQSPRLIVPVFLLGLILFCRRIWWQKVYPPSRQLILGTILLVILSLPLAWQFLSGEGSARFSGLSFLADPGPASRINELRGEHNNYQGIISKLLHNKVTGYTPSFLAHYLDHFSTQFLFIKGDEVIRNKVPESGQFYLVQAILLLIGVANLIARKERYRALILWWVLTAPLASSFTFQTPSALRSLSLVVPMVLVMGYGAASLWDYAKKLLREMNKKFFILFYFTQFCFILLLGIFLCFEFWHYLESYFVHYPQRYPIAWEYGFKEMVEKLTKYEKEFSQVVITDKYDQPYILVLFYKRYDPAKYQPQAVLSPRDRFNFGTVRGFDNYQFRPISFDDVQQATDTLFIAAPDEIPPGAKIIDQVIAPNGQPVFLFVQT